MKSRKVLMIAVFCVAFAGFARDGFGGDLTDKVIGIWGYKKHSIFNQDEYYFLEITKTPEKTTVACDTFVEARFYDNAALIEADGEVIVCVSSKPGELKVWKENGKVVATVYGNKDFKNFGIADLYIEFPFRIKVIDDDTIETALRNEFNADVTLTRVTAEAYADGVKSNREHRPHRSESHYPEKE